MSKMFVNYNNKPGDKLVIAEFKGLMEADKANKTILLTRPGLELDAPFAVLEEAFKSAARRGEPVFDLTHTELKRLREEAHVQKFSRAPGTKI